MAHLYQKDVLGTKPIQVPRVGREKKVLNCLMAHLYQKDVLGTKPTQVPSK
jgi:hypothetical protein